MKKIVKATLLASMAALALSACTKGNSGSNQPTGKYPAGFVMYNINNSWNEEAYQHSFSQAFNVGLTGANGGLWVGGSENSTNPDQKQLINDLLRNGAKVIAVSPENVTADFLNSLTVPVVLFDGRVDGFDKEICFVGYDYTEAAEKAAEFIGARIPQNSKVLVLTLENDPRTVQRAEMFSAKIKEIDPGVEIVPLKLDMYMPDDETNIAKMSIQEALMKNADIAGIYANDDDLAYFTYQALDNTIASDRPSGLKAVFGMGGSNRMQDVIKNHKLTGIEFATIECSPEIGAHLTDEVAEILRYGMPSSKDRISYPGKVIDKSNANPQ
ncbi:MAG: substrate-binding domain-containing protein [Rikenellaceae bacterium]|nr:substrate-binding domain-containing protein [Rikenellaceae bacterium]